MLKIISNKTFQIGPDGKFIKEAYGPLITITQTIDADLLDLQKTSTNKVSYCLNSYLHGVDTTYSSSESGGALASASNALLTGATHRIIVVTAYGSEKLEEASSDCNTDHGFYTMLRMEDNGSSPATRSTPLSSPHR